MLLLTRPDYKANVSIQTTWDKQCVCNEDNAIVKITYPLVWDTLV
jgi:hypothetical protein